MTESFLTSVPLGIVLHHQFMFMTLRHYRHINEEAQFDVLEQQGVLLAERETAFCTVRLYAVDTFYVEVHHHHHFNVIVKLEAFAATEKLDSWLQDISIDALLA